MIFEKITKLTRKDEFLEKIQIYIRLVEVIAKREHLIKGGKTKCEKAEDRINGLFVLYIKEL